MTEIVMSRAEYMKLLSKADQAGRFINVDPKVDQPLQLGGRAIRITPPGGQISGG